MLKKEIDQFVLDFINNSVRDTSTRSRKSPKYDNNASDASESESSASSGDDEDYRPSPKKARNSSEPKTTPKKENDELSGSSDVDDEAYARKLQAEESRGSRRNNKKGDKKKEGDGEKRKRKGESTYSRKCLLSPELAAIVGSNEMARHDVVKKMWEIVKSRNLYDPRNKQFAICDEQLRPVFGVKRFRTFGMMKYLKTHIKDQK